MADDELSRGHRSEARFNEEQHDLPHLHAVSDAEAVQLGIESANQLLAGITSPEDFVGREHFLAFIRLYAPDLNESTAGSAARGVLHPRAVVDNVYKVLDQESTGLVIMRREEVDMPIPPGYEPTNSWRAKYAPYTVVVQVGSLIDF